MNTDLLAAIETLADAVTAENAALLALDLPGAAGLLARKQAACAALVAVTPGGAPFPGPSPGLRAAAARLRGLAEENRRLLERGIAVQGQVIGVLASAARAADPAPRYARSGGYAARTHSGWALSARA